MYDRLKLGVAWGALAEWGASAANDTRTLQAPPTIISPKVFIKSFCKSQFPHKSVDSVFQIHNHTG